jgi:hypothetical protein
MATGPVQILVVDVGGGEPTGEVLAELQALAEQDIVRLLDLMVMRHHEDGQMEAFNVAATPDGGAKVAVLTGLHDGATGGSPDPVATEEEQDLWYVADAIPPGTTVAIALLEHRWAIGLRDALEARGGQLLAEAWVHPLDLVAVGLAEPEEE